ncbi:hypothetical protein [Calothrix sp. UHCC 0171]|uniref:hypothetical protein n=1 Tax=Calothrix sp. UHCC 0171 TaxID=3110245 RepID=UPI002B1F6072|nr:hypothetical protein [Calothrix sp. UHCC 0171]MEA5572117.1 hypothetical protein [Calothrix sp. UHCC 0171]
MMQTPRKNKKVLEKERSATKCKNENVLKSVTIHGTLCKRWQKEIGEVWGSEGMCAGGRVSRITAVKIKMKVKI